MNGQHFLCDAFENEKSCSTTSFQSLHPPEENHNVDVLDVNTNEVWLFLGHVNDTVVPVQSTCS